MKVLLAWCQTGLLFPMRILQTYQLFYFSKLYHLGALVKESDLSSLWAVADPFQLRQRMNGPSPRPQKTNTWFLDETNLIIDGS